MVADDGFSLLETLDNSQNGETIGSWLTETDSATALDRALRVTDLWKIYREVRGTLIQPRAGQIDRGVRIDRVLVPNQKLIDLGWIRGIIGIVLKRSITADRYGLCQMGSMSGSTWCSSGPWVHSTETSRAS